MTGINQKLLKELLLYNPDTGVFTTKINRGNLKSGSVAGHIHKKGYIRLKIKKEIYMAHRLAWLYMYGEWPKREIDHINHDKADNRILNLREATIKENKRNLPISKKNISGCTGVSWLKSSDKWRAYINIDKKQVYLGLFVDLEDAMAARKAANIKYGFHENHGS